MVSHPEQYAWSSYRSSAGLDAAEDWLDTQSLLELFDSDADAGRRIYQDFVLAKLNDSECIWERVLNGMYFGSPAWAKRMRTIVGSRPRSTDHPKAFRAVGRPQMHQIVTAVARLADQTAAALRAMRGGPLRRLVAWIGWHEGLLTLRSIAAGLRLRSEGHVSGMIRRCEEELGRDPALLARFDLAIAALRS